MCLYPRITKNKKYENTIKNGGIIPTVKDVRTIYVPIGCGHCIECKKQKANQWRARLTEDIKTNTNGHFITLTMSNESYAELDKITPQTIKRYGKNFKGEPILKKEIHVEGYVRDNKIAKIAVRLWLERWRKQFGKSLRHFLITELGHRGTENIHLHGIIWTDHPIEWIEKTWQYGFVWTGYNKFGKRINYVNEQTINYMVKYVTKADKDHKTYNSIILTSTGIGSKYIETSDCKRNQYNEKGTLETYRTRKGSKINLPIYYRNKIYSDDQKEQLWIEKLNKQERWILGQKVDISKGDEAYKKGLEYAQKINQKMGYGKPNDWKREIYENERRKLIQKARIQKGTNNQRNSD